MGHKLLLADDSITIQKVVGIIFSTDAYDLTVVDNGNDALVRAREAVPDIMLIDALMPGKNGYEVCREARKDPLLATVPILLLSGVFEPFDETKARESGADDFIAKPFESQVLIDKVKELIALGAARKAAPPVPPVSVTPPLDTPLVIPQVTTPVTPLMPPAPEPAQVSSLEEGEEILEIEEVTSLDDLWGMDLVEEVKQGEIPFGTVIAQQDGESLEGVEELVPFVIEEELPVRPVAYDFTSVPERFGETFTFELEPETPVVVSAEAPVVVPEAFPELAALTEEEFSFEAEPEVEEFVFDVEPGKVLPLVEDTKESFSFEESPVVVEPFTAPPLQPVEEKLHPLVETIEIEPPKEPSADFLPLTPPPIQEPPLPVVPPAVAEGALFTEEQLVAALSKVSRELIERIVWEVVPDLAEALIKEEIRKIREGV